MIHTTSARHITLAVATAFGLLSALPAAMAQTAAPAKPVAKKAVKAAPKKAAAAKPVVDLTPAAGPEQVDAATRVFYGMYECELGDKVEVIADAKHPSYVEVKHVKADYTMKPVLSSTGAIRLEDVKGETLMVQIAAKSMLLNTKTGHRIVDACVSPKQREMMDAPKTSATAATPAG
ncbi:MAG TPA: hypothetical protein VGM74_06810 [Burkholderiaceae bacterium]|jgi:hypothetical protein